MGQCDCWTSNDGGCIFQGRVDQTGKKIKDMETKKSEQTNRVEPEIGKTIDVAERAANGSDSVAYSMVMMLL